MELRRRENKERPGTLGNGVGGTRNPTKRGRGSILKKSLREERVPSFLKGSSLVYLADRQQSEKRKCRKKRDFGVTKSGGNQCLWREARK